MFADKIAMKCWGNEMEKWREKKQIFDHELWVKDRDLHWMSDTE